MPLYLFEQIRTGEFREVFFHMDDTKNYCGEDGKEEGLWERRYYVPQMSVDVKMDEWDSKGFTEKSGRKKGNLGNLFDESKELSEKRAKSAGTDPLKEAHLKQWKERRRRKSGELPKHSSEVARSIEILAE
jgi:hypothetical protein